MFTRVYKEPGIRPRSGAALNSTSQNRKSSVSHWPTCEVVSQHSKIRIRGWLAVLFHFLQYDIIRLFVAEREREREVLVEIFFVGSLCVMVFACFVSNLTVSFNYRVEMFL